MGPSRSSVRRAEAPPHKEQQIPHPARRETRDLLFGFLPGDKITAEQFRALRGARGVDQEATSDERAMGVDGRGYSIADH